MSAHHAIPVVDLFAGPGGLGEGFAACRTQRGTQAYRIALSIEKDPIAHHTLELRAFFRHFEPGRAPRQYYEHLRGRLSRQDLFNAYPAAAHRALQEAWCEELGPSSTDEVRRRIASEVSDVDSWVLIGGPPCQAYSNAGRSRNKGKRGYVPEQDARQYLYVEYLQILADHRPAVFVMENVKGLLSATLHDKRVFSRILEDLHSPADAIHRHSRTSRSSRALRYRIYSLTQSSMFGECDPADFLVRAEMHGIPQARHRIILVGVRDDIHDRAPGTLAVRAPVDARAVLFDLPPLRSGVSGGDDSPSEWRDLIRNALTTRWLCELRMNGHNDVYEHVVRAIKAVRIPRHGRGAEFVECDREASGLDPWYLDHRLEGVCNHASRGHMSSDLHRYLFASCFAKARRCSPNLRDFPKPLLPAHSNVRNALNGGHFGDRFRVQVANRPATTITSHISKDGHYYIHYDPTQCRSLTVREAARLQTFPDNYFFCGGRTSQYTQVGNAVPPLLAKEIAAIVLDLLT